MTTTQFDRLPLIQQNRMRNPVGFVYMTPRVQGSLVPDGSDNVGATTQMRFGGGQQFESEVTVDGIVGGRTQLTGSITEAAPPVDAVREFKVTNSLMSAEWGHTGIGVVNLQLKSGTNQFHGTAFEYLRNDKLDSRSWLAATRTTTRQNEFGFTAGGPVWLPKLYNGKDRTFFFVSYAGSRKRGATDTQAVQIATPENVAGDFSNLVDTRGALRRIYDPATTRAEAQRLRARCLPRQPHSRQPVRSRGRKNRRVPSRAQRRRHAQLPRPDRRDDSRSRYVRSQTGPLALPTSTAWPAPSTPARFRRLLMRNPLPPPLPSDASDQIIKGYTTRLTYDYVIRPTLLNQLSLGYNLFDHNNLTVTKRVFPSKTGSWPEELGLKGVIGTAFPVFTFTGGYAGFASTTGTSDDEQLYVLKEAVSWFKGKHSLKFGAEVRVTRSNLRSTGNMSGTFNFSDLGTALPTQATSTGNALASFLLGDVQSSTMAFPSIRAPRRPYTGFYVQDDLKLTTRLTLNLGFRFEYIQAPIDRLDRASTIDLTAPNPGAGGLPGAMIFAGTGEGRTGRRSFVDTDLSGYGPRLGLAYQLTPKTVLRTGYGIYYSNNYLELNNAGFNITGSFQSLDNGVTPAFHLRDGFPQNFRQESSIDPTFLNRNSGSFIEQSAAAMPRTQNWSFSVQREFSSNTKFEAVYIGSRGHAPDFGATGAHQPGGSEVPFPGHAADAQHHLRRSAGRQYPDPLSRLHRNRRPGAAPLPAVPRPLGHPAQGRELKVSCRYAAASEALLRRARHGGPLHLLEGPRLRQLRRQQHGCTRAGQLQPATGARHPCHRRAPRLRHELQLRVAPGRAAGSWAAGRSPASSGTRAASRSPSA